MSDPVKEYLAQIGAKGGRAKSDRKTAAVRQNLQAAHKAKQNASLLRRTSVETEAGCQRSES